jgi:hypothetical protein
MPCTLCTSSLGDAIKEVGNPCFVTPGAKEVGRRASIYEFRGNKLTNSLCIFLKLGLKYKNLYIKGRKVFEVSISKSLRCWNDVFLISFAYGLIFRHINPTVDYLCVPKFPICKLYCSLELRMSKPHIYAPRDGSVASVASYLGACLQ